MIHPYDDRILVKVLEEEDRQTTSGIFLPASARIRPQSQRGKVLMISQNCLSYHFECLKEGDIVIFGQYAGIEVEDGLEKYLLLKEEDIVGYLST